MTSTPTPPKQGVRARERNALERIELLEQNINGLVQAVQAAFNENEQKLRDISEVLDVFVAEKGRDVVQKAMADARLARAADEAKKAKDGLDLALIEGKVVQLDKVEEGAIITGVEKNKAGEVIQPGYVQLALSTVKPEFVEKMMGQAVGFTFETDGSGSFEVTGIYKAVPQSEPTAQETAPQAAPEAAPAA